MQKKIGLYLSQRKKITEGLFDDSISFEEKAIEVFRYQYQYNPVYKLFVQSIGRSYTDIQSIKDIPFLPIEAFKRNQIITGDWKAVNYFSSSGTTGLEPSKHYYNDLTLYKDTFLSCFTKQYGEVEDYCVLGLLPSYLERKGSSLIYMVDKWIQMSKNRHPQSGYFLYNHEDLHRVLLENIRRGTPTILIGVSFALLDFAEKYSLPASELIVMETGGMKGRRKEITRAELHQYLSSAFGVDTIHSEYGMTELFSQAYSTGKGVFSENDLMRVAIADIYDPFAEKAIGKTGVLQVIDLANIDSCSFIRTSDLGKKLSADQFEVLGRLDYSDIRGCNLMVE